MYLLMQQCVYNYATKLFYFYEEKIRNYNQRIVNIEQGTFKHSTHILYEGGESFLFFFLFV